MIDWSNKDSLRRRGNRDVRAVEVHETPEWTGISHRFTVMWSDTLIGYYTKSGRFNVIKDVDHPHDVIPAPLSGEGWMRKSSCDNGSLVIEPEKRHFQVEYIRVRWQEVQE